MWTRSELKSRARNRLKLNYLPCILVGIILLVALGSQQSVRVYETGNLADQEFMQLRYMEQTFMTFLLGPNQVIWNNIELILGGLAFWVFLLLQVFVFNPLEVGGAAFFVENSDGTPSVSVLFKMFHSESYRNVVMIMFLRDLYVYLWGLLLFIPGVIKSYEYYAIPYLLSENPMMTKDEAFRTTKEMMYDNKMKTFILELSFLPWQILKTVTFGLAGILYVNPYVRATMAELYLKLKDRYWSQNRSEPDIYVQPVMAEEHQIEDKGGVE